MATSRQCSPSPRGADLGVRDVAGSPARVVAVICRLASGGHPIAERGPALRWALRAVRAWSGSVLRTEVLTSGVKVPAGPVCVPGWCSAIGRTPLCEPGPHRHVGAVGFGCPERGRRRGACSALARRARAPHPPSPHRGTSGPLRFPGWLRGLPSYVAISSQERRYAAPRAALAQVDLRRQQRALWEPRHLEHS